MRPVLLCVSGVPGTDSYTWRRPFTARSPRRVIIAADMGKTPITTSSMALVTSADNVQGDANNLRMMESRLHPAQDA